MYTIKRWNGKYGDSARFLLLSPSGKMSEFCVGTPTDVAWVRSDLTRLPEYSKWQEFGNERVADYRDIRM